MTFQCGVIVEIHHLLSGNKRIGHHATIPLSTWHHRGQPYPSFNAFLMAETYGPSLARQSKAFHARYGTDQELLERTNKLLEAL
jgi:Recombination enhancement, RecA-dependent nuclease